MSVNLTLIRLCNSPNL